MLGVGRRAFSVSNCRLALVRREEISCGLERELLWSCERILVSVEVDMVGRGQGGGGEEDNERLERGRSWFAGSVVQIIHF